MPAGCKKPRANTSKFITEGDEPRAFERTNETLKKGTLNQIKNNTIQDILTPSSF